MRELGPFAVGGGAPCACIAEIGNAHNGSYERAIRLLDAAKNANATAAKLQCYSVAELLALRGDGPAPSPWGETGWSMRDLYAKAITPREWFAPLYAHAASIGLPIFSSVFGAESLDLLESIGNQIYKIARLDNGHRLLFDAVKATGKPIIVSYGPMQRGWDGRGEPGLSLWCKPGYPQTAPYFHRETFLHCDYDHVHTYGDMGFSYHGTSIEPPIVAATLGASLIECHFQLDDEPSELEASVSLTASQFKEMVRRVREVEGMLA